MDSLEPVPWLCRVLLVKGSNGDVALREELLRGRRELNARFRNLPPRTLRAGELLAARSSNVIYHLVAGWACRFCSFSDGHQAIVNVYLPGDVIGLEVLCTRKLEEVMALTSIVIERIDVENALTDLMTCRHIALYIAWLLGRRQRRTDRLVAAISSLDARGRLATMLLDFYTRLSRQKSITGSTFNLPLTQVQIGAYLGLTEAHVNRVLRSLRNEQIANLEKHCVTILDLERLKRLAQSDPIVALTAGLDQRLVDEPISRNSQPTQISVISGQPDLQRATVGIVGALP